MIVLGLLMVLLPFSRGWAEEPVDDNRDAHPILSNNLMAWRMAERGVRFIQL